MHVQTHIPVCVYMQSAPIHNFCVVYFSLGLSSTVSRRATKAGKQFFPQLDYFLTPSWSGTETGEQCKAQKQFLCSQETETSQFRSWDSELLPLYNL